MKLEQSFEVDAPLQRVWEALVDVERVAPCLPGAAVIGRNDDGSYNGTFSVKIGPTSASYAGKLQMEQIDESAHSATMQASGTDKRGQGGAQATIVSSLASAGGGGTRVEVSTDYHITGRLARFGRGGMIEEISNRLLREFAKNLQASLAGGGPPAASAGAGTPNGSEVTPPPAGAPSSTAPTPSSPAEASDLGEGAPAYGEAAAPPLGGAEPPTESTAAPVGEPEPAAQAVAEPPAIEGGEAPAYGEAAAPPLGEPEPAMPAPAEPPPTGPGAQPLTPPATEPRPAVAPDSPSAGTATQPPLAPAWTSPPASEPMQGFSLVGGALWRQVKRNPAPMGGLLVALLALLRLMRRGR